MDRHRRHHANVYTPFAELDLLLAEEEQDARRAARARGRATCASPRRSTRSTRRSSPGSSRPRGLGDRATRSARRRDAVAPPRRARALAPVQRAPDPQRGQPVGARGERGPARALDRAVAAGVARGGEAVVERQPARRGRLGQDLGVVEVEAAAEREPRGREHERRAAPAPRPRSAATRIAADTSAGKRSGQTSGRRSSAARSSAARRTAAAAVASSARQRGAARRRGRRPDDVVERALDALGGEVGERAGEVEEELRARALAAGGRRRSRRASLRSAAR